MSIVYLADSLTSDGQRRVKFFTDTDTDKFFLEDDNGIVTEINLTGAQGPIGPTGATGADATTIGITDDIPVGGATFSYVDGLLVSVECIVNSGG
jgi:hypothetical protein